MAPQLLPSYYVRQTPPVWEFDTVADCTTVGVPISTTTAYTGMTIDWGDGNTTTVSSVDDYVHTYETAGQYHISVSYDDWKNVELSYYSVITTAPSPIEEARASIAKVYAIPTVANTEFSWLFNYYTALTEVADDIFANNPQITSFYYTFHRCTSLTSIPSGLFDNNTAVTNFGWTFDLCTALTGSIPTDLFRYNTAATNFYGTFYQCTRLTSIPSDLFRYNTAATNFTSTFNTCVGLTNQTVYIGSEIVRTAYMFMYNTGDGNTVYVPADSTTYETLLSESFLGCTVATY